MKSRKDMHKRRCGYRKTQRGAGFMDFLSSINPFSSEKKEEVPPTTSEPSSIITRKNIPSFGLAQAQAPASQPAPQLVSQPAPQTMPQPPSFTGGKRKHKRSHKKRATKRKH